MTLILRRSVLVLTLLSLSSFLVPAQLPTQAPDEKPRKLKREPNKAYKEWAGEHDIVMTQSERDAWKVLATDEEREQFIQEFWRLRDPDPDTEENEYKLEFYERVSYANQHFSSGKAGRLTDRGRMYIKFGKPDEIESHPMGGSYERPSYEGGGSTSTYPFEKWFYRHIPNISSGIELEFVDPSGSGEYRLARNPNEKDALLMIPGAGLTLEESLGLGQKSDRISGLGSYGDVNYRRVQDSPFEVLNLLTSMERDLPVERRLLGNITDTPIVDDNPLHFETQFNYFRQSDNRVLAALTIQTENSELSFTDSGGLKIARMNIVGRITTVADKRAGNFEDSVTTTATVDELTSAKMRKSAYAKAFILAPGRYRADVVVRDIESGAFGKRSIGFVVPEFPVNQLTTSSIVLAAKLENTANTGAGGPFNIGTTKVIPNLTGVFKRGQPVGVYLQVYNAAIDQTTLRPAADVTYVLLKNGKEIGQQLEDWKQVNDSGQRLTLTRLIDSKSIDAGEYELQIRVHDHVTGQTISPSTKLTIEP